MKDKPAQQPIPDKPDSSHNAKRNKTKCILVTYFQNSNADFLIAGIESADELNGEPTPLDQQRKIQPW